MGLAEQIRIDQVLGYYAAGQTKRTSDIVDMSGWDGVVFVAGLGTLLETGTLDVFVEQNTANSPTGMARLATTTAYTVTAADALIAKNSIQVDVYRPQERYLQCNITPAVANAVILGIVAIRYRGTAGRKAAVSQGGLKTTTLTSPAEV